MAPHPNEHAFSPATEAALWVVVVIAATPLALALIGWHLLSQVIWTAFTDPRPRKDA